MRFGVPRHLPATMNCEMKSTIVAVCFLVTVLAASAAADSKLDSPNGNDNTPSIEDVQDTLTPILEEDKRIFRYGRGGLLRYGKRGGIFRYGKRGAILRYGRGGLFRYGRSDDDVNIFDDAPSGKRLFRWGKRSDDYDDLAAAKRIFRYGKRPMDLDEAIEAAKARLLRATRDKPHVPFRFGDEE